MSSLILASGSTYRRQILDKLHLKYEWASPDIDETALPDEAPTDLVRRLSHSKATALTKQFPEHLIIGSDQVATLEGKILGKPGNHQKAMEQLRLCNGKRVTFITGLTLLNSKTRRTQTITDTFSVVFRQLTEAQINTYLDKEKPYDCAGSFKSEGLGIALFEKLEGNDPNSLIGLPLIRLIDLLAEENVAVLQEC